MAPYSNLCGLFALPPQIVGAKGGAGGGAAAASSVEAIARAVRETAAMTAPSYT